MTKNEAIELSIEALKEKESNLFPKASLAKGIHIPEWRYQNALTNAMPYETAISILEGLKDEAKDENR